MFELKNKAIELRKQGKSYRSIGAELRVPISTLSVWLSPFGWSEEIARNLKREATLVGSTKLSQARKARGFALQFSYAKAGKEAELQFKKLKKNPLFIAGTILYWSAGDMKSKYYCKLRSADPQKMRLYKDFLEEICEVKVKFIRCTLQLSTVLDEEIAKNDWSQKAKIPLFCFTKSVFIRKKRNKTPLPTSACTTTYSSRYLKEKLLVWTRLLGEEFSKS